jgi:hypothetical protein
MVMGKNRLEKNQAQPNYSDSDTHGRILDKKQSFATTKVDR